jgi:hypothetical protein
MLGEGLQRRPSISKKVMESPAFARCVREHVDQLGLADGPCLAVGAGQLDALLKRTRCGEV